MDRESAASPTNRIDAFQDVVVPALSRRRYAIAPRRMCAALWRCWRQSVPDPWFGYEFAGLLRGAHTCVWHNAMTGLDASAGAEILLEDFIHPGGIALKNPFGDRTGYYNAQAWFPVLTIERMPLWRDGIYHGNYMGRAPHDEPSVMGMALNDVFVPILRKVFPNIVDFYQPPEARS